MKPGSLFKKRLDVLSKDLKMPQNHQTGCSNHRINSFKGVWTPLLSRRNRQTYKRLQMSIPIFCDFPLNHLTWIVLTLSLGCWVCWIYLQDTFSIVTAIKWYANKNAVGYIAWLFSLPFYLMMIVRIRVLYLLIVKSELSPVYHCFVWGHAAMLCVVCLFIFFFLIVGNEAGNCPYHSQIVDLHFIFNR